MTSKVYSKEFDVHYYEVNKYKEATPVAILNYLEETAVWHSESIGLGIDTLKTGGISWVLNRWNLVIDQYPKWNDRILIETWSSGIDRFFATREFLIKNDNKDTIGRASSLWIYLNLEKKRPVRIPSHYGELYSLNECKAIENPFVELTMSEDFDYSKEFFVRKCDIDTNNHVNNTKYLEWLIESIPDETYEDCILKKLEILYKKETRYGMNVSSNRKAVGENNPYKNYVHSITSTDNIEHAVARSFWTIR